MSDTPIIGRITDALDYYKFTMAYFARKHFPDTHVRYAFTNRTEHITLPQHIDIGRLREELGHVRRIGFSRDEIRQLHSREEFHRFPEWFFDFLLNDVYLPPVHIEERNGRLAVETEGNWATGAIWWETIILAVISELYWESVTKELGYSRERALVQGVQNLTHDLAYLLDEAPGARIALFGARRRFSTELERRAHETFMHVAPDLLLGTSTVGHALRYNLPIVGTNAHELPMVLFGVYRDLMGEEVTLDEVARVSQNDMLNMWWDMYGEDLAVGLTDTYSTAFFLGHFGSKRAQQWHGFRQDSGDPFTIGETYIRFWKQHGINSKEKLILFTDGLEAETITRLWQAFHERVDVGFGWGTNATNNVFPNKQFGRHVSQVIKAVEANGQPLVKLSDNPAKFSGDAATAQALKTAIGYADTEAIETIY